MLKRFPAIDVQVRLIFMIDFHANVYSKVFLPSAGSQAAPFRRMTKG